LGKVAYPEDVMDMTQLLTNRRGINTNRSKQIEEIQDGVLTSFHQQGQQPSVKCSYCNRQGHVKETCRKRIADEAHAANTTGISTTNTQGWFDDVNPAPRGGVSSFQAWLADED
jgi:hypothetical protein